MLEVAFVLPKDYGFGLRRVDDRIWGFWGPDDKSPIIWNNLNKLLGQYGSRLDLVYDDPAYPLKKETTQKCTIGTKRLVN